MSQFKRFHKLREAFRATFWLGKWRNNSGELSDNAREVLEELKRFCNADNPSVVVAKDGRIDSHATMYAEGKRAVLLRLQALLSLTDEQLMAIKRNEENE
jgi:hypothetical protein